MCIPVGSINAPLIIRTARGRGTRERGTGDKRDQGAARDKTQRKKKETGHSNIRSVHGEASNDKCKDNESKRTNRKMRREKTTEMNAGGSYTDSLFK